MMRDKILPAGILCHRPPIGVSRSGADEPIIVEMISGKIKIGENWIFKINKKIIDENNSPVER